MKPTEKRVPVIHITRADFDITFTCGSGKGGQNRNRRHTAVRIRHRETGIEAYCCRERSQKQNMEEAFRVIAERLIPWIKREHN